ncbi:MAG: twin-arginine translocase subunit TatC [Gemmatimonadota bacterium]|nr:twin-arginine translocase subunit TatC [Gemmatimonadota bacterium]
MRKQPSAEMPFLDHLEELRWRLIWSLGALGAGIIIGFVVVMQFDVIGLLARPITPLLQGQKLVFTHPGDPFSILMKAAFAVGLVLAAPVILYQVWAFIAPALYGHERRVVIPVIVGAVALFVSGVALAYFIILPVTLRFLLGLQTESLQSMISAADYFGFAISMSLAFGAAFELPIVIVALTALGLVTPRFLTKYRRHAVVLVLVVSAIITPGADLTSLFALAIPLYFLYEVSIVLAFAIHHRRERRRLREEAEAAAEAGTVDDSGVGNDAPRGLMDRPAPRPGVAG